MPTLPNLLISRSFTIFLSILLTFLVCIFLASLIFYLLNFCFLTFVLLITDPRLCNIITENHYIRKIM